MTSHIWHNSDTIENFCITQELVRLGIRFPRAYGGGVSGVSGNPFDSKAISKITYLNKYTIINILASYA